jgi:uncharacterized short protein YbdD (DUF466 family)
MKWLKKIIYYVNEIAGVPNYKRYLAHFQKYHPDENPMSEKEFHCRAIDEKYGSSSIRRCC